ncbi:MAG: hypothetical protein JWO68_2632 [Actinomycetia bacterium]|nr:hypothetical protein [Actinomycetes bacterium]
MRWLVLGVLVVSFWSAAAFLTIRHVGGIRRLNETVSQPGFPSAYMIGALVASVVAAVLINPANKRSFNPGDWIRTAAIVASTLLSGRRMSRRAQQSS